MTTKDTLASLRDPVLVVKKEKRQLELYDGSVLIKTYKIAMGFDPTGGKRVEGDGKTPEGEYYVSAKNPKSKFHLSIGISYPGIEDAKRGLDEDLISQAEYDEIVDAINNRRIPPQRTRLGGEIYIHGGGVYRDWTDGCVALDNSEMAELFNVIPTGTKVKVTP